MTLRDNIEYDGFTFRVEHERDVDAVAPWEDCEGHGPVSGWETRDKRPGELVLNSDSRGRCKRFYDLAEAQRIALRDGWYARGATEGMTKRQVAALAARENYEYLRAWCNDEWCYICVVVTLLDADGNETGATSTLCGVDDDGTYAATVAQDLAGDIVCGYGLNYEDCDSLTIGSTTWKLLP